MNRLLQYASLSVCAFEQKMLLLACVARDRACPGYGNICSPLCAATMALVESMEGPGIASASRSCRMAVLLANARRPSLSDSG